MQPENEKNVGSSDEHLKTQPLNDQRSRKSTFHDQHFKNRLSKTKVQS